MLRVIPKEEIRARTEAMRHAIPEDRRAEAVEVIRRYADQMDARYQRLVEELQQEFGEDAEVSIRELNKPKFGWERSVADRLEGKTVD